MFVDTASISPGHIEPSRICIFGSGPAGLTIARILAERGREVLLIEAGGMEFEQSSQDLYKGEVIGDPYFDLSEARLRQFGGSSGHWGGFCRTLDSYDFTGNPAFPLTGWPISIEDISPYLAQAADILDVPADFDNIKISADLLHVIYRFSPPTHLGEKYRSFAETSPNLKICLNTALVNMAPEGRLVRTAEVVTENGDATLTRWSIEADIFVMCLGGIENSRLLLWMNERNNRALIANHDIIGRYWMEHPVASAAEAVLFGARTDIFQDGEAYLALSGDYQRRNGLLNIVYDTNAQAYQGSKKLIADIMCAAPALGGKLMNALGKELVCGARMRAQWEQAPDPENRVSLGAKPDRLGIPRVELHWRRTAADRRTVVESTKAIAKEFAENDVGRIRLLEWIENDDMPIPTDRVMASWHHMGGTRMSDDPQSGVVDRNSKVHDLDNLYIGGSSVFPSCGYANPTLSIVQLALRLADHLTPLV